MVRIDMKSWILLISSQQNGARSYAQWKREEVLQGKCIMLVQRTLSQKDTHF